VSSPACWAVVPAAGVGRRMGGEIPKQYLPLGGRRVIEQSLSRLLDHPSVRGVCVVLSAGDLWWRQLSLASDSRILTVEGGEERANSVLNGLRRLEGLASPDDWVLVHDAARPCLHASDIDRLIEAVIAGGPGVGPGGLLAIPLHDTLKLSKPDTPCVEKTLPRERFWRAFTPQMFPIGLLRRALESALEKQLDVTDEASAMELAGYSPQLVEGRSDNIKITRPEDLLLAEFYLRQQEEE